MSDDPIALTRVHERSPLEEFLERIDLPFIARTWLVAMAITIPVAIIMSLLLGATVSNLRDGPGTQSGVAFVATGFATFVGFFAALVFRLPRKLEHDRLFNSLALAVFHIAIGVGVVVLNVVADTVTGSSLADMLFSSSTPEASIAFFVVASSGAIAIFACLIAPGLLPSVGATPRGRQRGSHHSDHTL